MSLRGPELEPLLAIRSGRYYYLCTYMNAWDPERKRSYRKNTTSVGKITSGRRDGTVEWKESYIERHPDLASYSCVRDKDGTLVFTPLSEVLDPADALSPSLSIGATWTLCSVVNKTPFMRALEVVFSKYSDWRKILSVAFFMNLSSEKVLNKISEFSKHHYLPWTRVLSPDDVMRLMSRITAARIALFMNTVAESLKDDTRCLVFCSSSVYRRHTSFSWTAHCDSEYGPGQGSNSLTAVRMSDGMPVCYFVSDGEKFGSLEAIRALTLKLTRHDLLKNSIFVGDRGYASVKQISEYLRNEVNFLVTPRMHHGLFKPLLKKLSPKLFALENYKPVIGCSAFAYKTGWTYHVRKGGHVYRHNAKLWLHVFFDEDVYNRGRERLKHGIGLVYESLSRGEVLNDDLEDIKTRYMSLNPKTGDLEVNDDAVKTALARRSVRILLSDVISDPVEAFCDYFDRNEIWAGFRNCQERFNSRNVLDSDELAPESCYFLEFVSLAAGLMLRKRLQLAQKEMSGLPYNCDDVILQILSGITISGHNGGKATLSEISNKIKKMLSIINVDLPSGELPLLEGETRAATLAEKQDYEDLIKAEHSSRPSREERVLKELL